MDEKCLTLLEALRALSRHIETHGLPFIAVEAPNYGTCVPSVQVRGVDFPAWIDASTGLTVDDVSPLDDDRFRVACRVTVAGFEVELRTYVLLDKPTDVDGGVAA